MAIPKVLAVLVVVVVLGAQLFAIVRPSGAVGWPFVDYPMYARSYQPGTSHTSRELRVVACGADRAQRVPPRSIGYGGQLMRERLHVVVRQGPAAAEDRERLSRAVSAAVTPRPCTIQVWEWRLQVTRDGVDGTALRAPDWTARLEWPIDAPDRVRELTPR